MAGSVRTVSLCDSPTSLICIALPNDGNNNNNKFCLLSLQLRIQVCDLGGLCNVTVAAIAVRTNRFAPELNANSYSRRIPETWTVGEGVFDVNATDLDLAVSLSHPTTPTSPNHPTTLSLSLFVAQCVFMCLSPHLQIKIVLGESVCKKKLYLGSFHWSVLRGQKLTRAEIARGGWGGGWGARFYIWEGKVSLVPGSLCSISCSVFVVIFAHCICHFDTICSIFCEHLWGMSVLVVSAFVGAVSCPCWSVLCHPFILTPDGHN